MYKEDLALNNLQWLICHKTKLNQIIYIYKEDLALNNLQWLKPHHQVLFSVILKTPLFLLKWGSYLSANY